MDLLFGTTKRQTFCQPSVVYLKAFRAEFLYVTTHVSKTKSKVQQCFRQSSLWHKVIDEYMQTCCTQKRPVTGMTHYISSKTILLCLKYIRECDFDNRFIARGIALIVLFNIMEHWSFLIKLTTCQLMYCFYTDYIFIAPAFSTIKKRDNIKTKAYHLRQGYS